MWSFEYNSETCIFVLDNQEAGFSFSIQLEDGMRSEIINQNPVAFFYSKRPDATNQVKTVLCVNIQTYTLDISIRLSEDEHMKHEITLSPQVAKTLYSMAKLHQHQKIVPSFSFKPVVRE